jgi:dethiobiotin synthetase
MAMLDENITALRQRIPAPLLGIVPRLEQPDACAAASFLNLASLEQADLHD